MSLAIETLHTVDTEYSADSVEWCPQSGSTDYFLCGTYQLEENPPSTEVATPVKRKGRLYLFNYAAEDDVLQQRDSHETAAILDVKWMNGENAEPIAGAANALGEVMLYRLVDGKLKQESVFHLNANDDNLLTLAIDWNPASESVRRMVSSDSKGYISLLELSNTGLELVSRWSSHSFEAWTCAFDKWNPNVVYSGGDDMALCVHDTRTPDQKVLTNRSHNAGVTTLLSFGDTEHRLATGSYDEQLRVFDTRRFKNELSSVNLGGGIWRIRQNPVHKDWLLCANMYHNFSVVRGIESPKVVAEYFEHKSICYGADWSWAKAPEGRGASHIMGTCSFYDHKLCVSRVTEVA